MALPENSTTNVPKPSPGTKPSAVVPMIGQVIVIDIADENGEFTETEYMKVKELWQKYSKRPDMISGRPATEKDPNAPA
jgi:hypothetical protein